VSELLERDKLVFNQKAKLIELNAEFAIRDSDGNQIGFIKQEGQSKAKKLVRALTKLDQFMTHTLSVYDTAGAKVVELTRPAKILKSTVVVRDGAGAEAGRIVQKNAIGKIRFSLEDAQGNAIGSINAENWRAWNFNIKDASETEVARITKTWEGLAKTLFTTADDYVLEVSGPTTPALRLLILASAAGVDLALKQDARGLN
jgi:uncharacterized protein YxjI